MGNHVLVLFCLLFIVMVVVVVVFLDARITIPSRENGFFVYFFIQAFFCLIGDLLELLVITSPP